MNLVVCIFFVGLAHFSAAQTGGGSNFDFSSFSSATSSGGASGTGTGTFNSPTNIPPVGTVTATGGSGTFGQTNTFPQTNNFPQNNPNGFPMTNTNPQTGMNSNLNTLNAQNMNNAQMMNNGQFMNGQTMGNTQLMNNNQMMNNGQAMNNQMMNNGQVMNNQMMTMNGQSGFMNANGQMMQNGQMSNAQSMLQNGMLQDPTRMGALSNTNFNQLAFNPNTQSGLFQNQLNAQNMPQFGGQQSQFGQQQFGQGQFGQNQMMQQGQFGQGQIGGFPRRTPFMGPQMIRGPFGQQMFGAIPASPFTGTPGFGIFQDPFMNAFAPPSPFLGQPQFFPAGPMMVGATVDANGNPVTTGQGSQQMTTTQGQSPAFNSFLFPANSQTNTGNSFNMQPGGTLMTNNGMFTTTQFFDASSGMPIGTPNNVIRTATGQLVDGNTGLPVTSVSTTQMNPGGVQTSSTGFQGTSGIQSTTGFQGTGFSQIPAANTQNSFSTNTGMATAIEQSPFPFALPMTAPSPLPGLTAVVPMV